MDPDPRAPEADVDDPLDELVARVLVLRERGSTDALEQVCAEHPDSAERLARRLSGLERVQGAFASLRTASRADDLPRTWGRYVLERELGRGGMGVVYLARDERLDRPVALKAMTAAVLAGERGRRRFEREAQAVAALAHPGIVPVWDTGEEDGVPYFTMEYVEGRTVAQALDALRELDLPPARLSGSDLARAAGGDPAAPEWEGGFPELACRIALDVAEALEHAHEQGVVHRDVKPSNVQLRADGRARLFDFGLARLEASASMTRTGDFVGTPSYVSPEQARGEHAEVDGRTDVYSLGATLYELLTLRVPFAGASTEEVLRRIATQEPPSVRGRNPAVPRDLETVCRTALATDPADRYPTAADLAADLRRFLEGRPVLARPLGPWTRVLRWTRRNPAPATAAGLALVLVVGGPLAFGVANRLARQRLEAEQALTERERDRADRNLSRVLITIDEMLTRVAEDDLARLPRTDRLRRELLARALVLYRELLADQDDDASVRRETALAQRRLASVLYELGELGEARPAVERAIALTERVIAAAGDSPSELEDLALCQTLRGLVEHALGDLEAAEAAQRAALELRERAAAAAPDAERDGPLTYLAQSHLNLGNVLLERGRQAETERAYRRALELWTELLERAPSDPERQADVASGTLNLGNLLTDVGRVEEAAQLYGHALELWRGLRARDPEEYGARLGVVSATTNLAEVLAKAGRADEALELCAEALAEGEALAAERPDVLEAAKLVAVSRGTAVAALVAAGRHAEAVEEGERALAELDALAERFPEAGELRRRRMGVQDELANAYQALGRLADEVATRELAVRARTELVAAEPDHLPQHSRLGGALNNLARALHDSGESERAVELLHEAVRHQRLAFEHDPENPQYRRFLRNHLWGLAETSLACGDPDAAAAAACELATLDSPEDGTEHRRAVWLLARSVAQARGDGSEEADPAVADRVGAWTAAAVELLAVALERGASSLADLEQATDLEPLRAHPDFAALVAATRAATDAER